MPTTPLLSSTSRQKRPSTCQRGLGHVKFWRVVIHVKRGLVHFKFRNSGKSSFREFLKSLNDDSLLLLGHADFWNEERERERERERESIHKEFQLHLGHADHAPSLFNLRFFFFFFFSFLFALVNLQTFGNIYARLSNLNPKPWTLNPIS